MIQQPLDMFLDKLGFIYFGLNSHFILTISFAIANDRGSDIEYRICCQPSLFTNLGDEYWNNFLPIYKYVLRVQSDFFLTINHGFKRFSLLYLKGLPVSASSTLPWACSTMACPAAVSHSIPQTPYNTANGRIRLVRNSG